MKRITLILAAFAAAFAVSCNKENSVETNDQSAPAGMKLVTITATVEGATKTSYSDNGEGGGVFSWTKGDKIAIVGSDGNLYTFNTDETNSTANFSGYLPEGCTLGDYALYPADEGHAYDAGNNYPYSFMIPKDKDLTKNPSADLPLHGEKDADGTYLFKHMTGGFKFTINNFDDIFKTAEVSIVTSGLKISGSFQVRKSSTHSGYVTYAAATDVTDELSYVRKVNVVDNSVEIYFPYSPGNDLWGTTSITVVGYDSENNPVQLLNRSADFGGLKHVRATIFPVVAIELPDYVPPVNWTKIDWNSTAVATVTNDPESADACVEELKLVADDNYLYAWIKSALETPYGGNYIDIYLSDGDSETEGAVKAWDQWPGTLGIDIYKKEHKGTIDSDGNITSMTFNHNGQYEDIEFKNELVDDKINWYLAFPRNYIEAYKSDAGTIHVGFRLWTDWSNYAAIPARGWGQSMLEVALP